MAAQILNLKQKSVSNENLSLTIPPKEIKDESQLRLTPELQEAIDILGLNHPTFKHSEDYDWMLDTTREILKKHGIVYFRKDVMNLMKAWADYS